MTPQEIFESIYQWNKERDLLRFNHRLEVMLLIEEMFELCGYKKEEIKDLVKDFTDKHTNISSYIKDDKLTITTNPEREMSLSDVVDALGDIVYLAIGSLYKLGYNPATVLSAICEHNNKKGKERDTNGKIIKTNTFVEPIHKID